MPAVATVRWTTALPTATDPVTNNTDGIDDAPKNTIQVLKHNCKPIKNRESLLRLLNPTMRG
jgi:hypothetical protein